MSPWELSKHFRISSFWTATSDGWFTPLLISVYLRTGSWMFLHWKAALHLNFYILCLTCKYCSNHQTKGCVNPPGVSHCCLWLWNGEATKYTGGAPISAVVTYCMLLTHFVRLPAQPCACKSYGLFMWDFCPMFSLHISWVQNLDIRQSQVMVGKTIRTSYDIAITSTFS